MGGAWADGTALPASAGGGEVLRSEWERSLERLEQEPDPLVLKAVLEGMQREFPGRVAWSTYGQSRAGRPLYVLRLEPTDLNGETPSGSLPIAWVVPDMDAPPRPAALLAAANHWLRSGKGQGNIAVCVVPVPNPDAWIDGPRAGAVQLERNFPFGWTPWLGAGQNPGPAPLSEPESRSLVQWALEHPGVMGLVRWQAQASEGASLVAYAAEVLGIPSVAVDAEGPESLTRGLRVLDGLRDRVEGRVLGIRRLSETLWSVDFELRNVAEHALGASPPELHWQVIGGVAKAAAQGPAGAEDLALLPKASVGRLPVAGQGCTVRVVIECAGSDSLFVRFDGARLPALTLAVALPKAVAQPR
ncbi:MAG: hypothetical protein H6829_03610 [Planctomycetes bacterium]|nr:hypothetical protein [Planctomycetota bacterium]